MESKENAVAIVTKTSIFNSIASFEDGQRIAKMLCTSDLVPAVYKGNIPNTMIALEMATRIGISPFMVMQNLDIIQGKPSWRSTFIIAALNSCGRFKPLKFEFVGIDPLSDDYGCRAYTFDLDNIKLVGPVVNWQMVKAEGWLTKSGSKWKTMPELMFQYRAASFFGRLYAPDILNGMQSVEETKDAFSSLDKETVYLELNQLFDEIESAGKIPVESYNRWREIIEAKEEASYSKLTQELNKIKKQCDTTKAE